MAVAMPAMLRRASAWQALFSLGLLAATLRLVVLLSSGLCFRLSPNHGIKVAFRNRLAPQLRRDWNNGRVSEIDEGMTESVTTRLDRLSEVLEGRGLRVVKRAVYEDAAGDGTGALGWMWVRAEPPLFPDDDHDVALTYSEIDDAWSLGTPGGEQRRVEGAGNVGETVGRVLLDECASPGSPVRALPDWMWLVLGGTGTTVVLPFITALVGKSAEDAYAALRSLLRKSKPELSAGRVEIFDDEHDVRIIGPDPIPKDAVRQLALLDRTEIRGHVLVWDDATATWFRFGRRP